MSRVGPDSRTAEGAVGTKCGHSVVVDAAGAMTPASPTWSRDLPVRFAAIEVPTSGRCSSTRGWGPVRPIYRYCLFGLAASFSACHALQAGVLPRLIGRGALVEATQV
jgi:hypothetical protein